MNEQIWIEALYDWRSIEVEVIDSVIAASRGVITANQVDHVARLRAESLELFASGEKLAAMYAGQAMLESAKALHADLVEKQVIQAGRNVIKGGKVGAAKRKHTRDPDTKRVAVIKAIDAYKGDKRSMAGILAKRLGVTATYVRQIKAQHILL